MILRLDSHHPDFLALEVRLNAFLAILNGDKNEFYAAHNQLDRPVPDVVAYVAGCPVGCGAFRPCSDGTVEIKRMFVDSEHRGKSIGHSILLELESWARLEGAAVAILETSQRLEAAVGLYRKSGYSVISNYGPYADVEDSICMSKNLA